MKKWLLFLVVVGMVTVHAQGNDLFFVLNNLSKTISVYDPVSQVVDTSYLTVDPVPGNTSPNDFAVINDTMYVVMGLSDMLNVIDLKTRQVIQSISLKPSQNDAAVNPNAIYVNDSLIYITAGAHNSLILIDRKTLAIRDYIPAGIGPENLTLYGDTLLISATGFNYTDYSSNPAYLIYFDLKSNQKVDSVSFDHYNMGPVEFLNGDTLLALCRGDFASKIGAIYKIELKSKEILAVTEFIGTRFVFGYSPARNHLFIGSWGAFDVLNADLFTDTLYTDISGNGGFLDYDNNLFVLNWDLNAMVSFDQNYSPVDTILLGHGPMVLKKVNVNIPLTINEKDQFVSDNFVLSQNYPNPFNPVTYIPFQLHKSSDVKLEIFNITGEKVATLVNGFKQSGDYKIKWDARNVPSGVYFYKLTVNNHSQVRKMILVK